MLKSFIPSVLVTVLTTTTINTLAVRPLIAGSTTNLQGIRAKVVVHNVNYSGNKFIGQVLNRSGKNLESLKLYYKVLNGQGQIIDVGSVYIMENELISSQHGRFQGKTQKVGATLIVTSAEWLGN